MPIQYVGGRTVTGNSGTLTLPLTGLTGGIDTEARTGDYVIAAYAAVSAGALSPTVGDGTWVQPAALFGNDTRDANLRVGYKIMGVTPDTQVQGSGNTVATNGAVMLCQVWRGVNASPSNDVIQVGATGTNSAIPDPPAITPVTQGAVIVVIGCGTGVSVDSSVTAPTGYGNHIQATVDPGNAIIAAMASKAWSGSGAEDPPAWTNWTTSTSDAWAAFTFALRPGADTTAPTLSSQTVDSITSGGGTPKVTTNEGDGTAYMVVVADGDSPSVTQIKAGQNSSGGAALANQNQAVTGTGVQTFSAVSGLNPATAYDVWFVHRDAAGNDSSAVKADFTTLAALPTVTTNAATGVTHHAATGNGDITATGGENALRRGFVYSLTSRADPGNVSPASSPYEFSASEIAGSYGTGTFSRALTVVPDTTYYIRAYAENSAGFKYGGEVNFTTPSAPIEFSPSGNIAAGGGTATTAQLTAPSGKTSGANFQAGKISDDTNPLAALDLAADKYTELEWSIKVHATAAVDSDVYEFRVTNNGVPLTTYSVTPTITVGDASKVLTAEAGAVAIGGVAASLEYGRRLVAQAGNIGIAGVAATFRHNRKVAAAAGSVSVTGAAAGLRATRRVTAAPGAVAVTGVAATLAKGRTLNAQSGQLAVTGVAASLRTSKRVVAQAGSVAVIGIAATLRPTRKVLAQAGAVAITGIAADLSRTFVGVTLTAQAGNVSLTGIAATFRYNRIFVLESGNIAVTGVAASFKFGRKVISGIGTVTITGVAADLRKLRGIVALTGNVTLQGQPASLAAARRLTGAPGAVALQGVPAILRRVQRPFTAEAGAIAISGVDAEFDFIRRVWAEVGNVSIFGEDVVFFYSGANRLPTDIRTADVIFAQPVYDAVDGSPRYDVLSGLPTYTVTFDQAEE